MQSRHGLLHSKINLLEERQLFSNRMLRAMIVPLFIEQLLQMTVGLADTLMVSYAGENVVSGVSLVTMIYTVFLYLFTAVATGGAVVVSQYLGSRDMRNADLASSQLFMIAGLISAVCMLPTLALGDRILQALYSGVEEGVMTASSVYLRIIAYSFPANALYNAGAALYRSMGKTSVTMAVTAAMNLLNVTGNAVGIFILHAGVAGVAWPTTISWVLAAIVMTALCFRSDQQVRLRLKDILCIEKDMDIRVLRMAVPNAVEYTLFQLAKVVLGALVATFGTAQIAANGIGQTIWSFASCVVLAMSPVFITVIGQCMGSGDKEAADWYMHKLVRMTMILGTLWNAFVLLLMPLILPLYSISDETRHLVLIIVIMHNVCSAILHPFYSTLSAGIRAAGDVKFAMWSSIFATVVCRTLLSFIFGKWLGMGVIGITLAMCIDWLIKGVMDIYRWRSGRWMEFKVI